MMTWRLTCALLACAFLTNVEASDRIVDEETVESWGYQTVRLGPNQKIRRIKKYVSGGKNYYARFYLWRDCYESADAAKSEVAAIEKAQREDARARSFDYRKGHVVGSCVFFMNTNAMMFKLDYQDELFELYVSYIDQNYDP